ncbi:hypothetical protein ACO0LC_10160 [Undibacterium sp. JH2W]|uniref:hypothetical protein n=1 Tax=Undibacterium sp. JH2W TaxID=3413037 RepID=UPI003BEF9760
MQRLYSMFPAGRAGAGLLILRIVVALQLPAASACCSKPAMADWIDMLIEGLAVLLCIGILTPLLALLCVATAALCLFGQGVLSSMSPVICLVIANAIALALLGPGAYSLDAKFFGRRLIVLSDTRP